MKLLQKNNIPRKSDGFPNLSWHGVAFCIGIESSANPSPVESQLGLGTQPRYEDPGNLRAGHEMNLVNSIGIVRKYPR